MYYNYYYYLIILYLTTFYFKNNVDAFKTLQDLVNCCEANHNIGAVIVDYDVNFNFVKLQKAVEYLKRPDVIFITGATETKIAVGHDILLIGIIL